MNDLISREAAIALVPFIGLSFIFAIAMLPVKEITSDDTTVYYLRLFSTWHKFAVRRVHQKEEKDD